MTLPIHDPSPDGCPDEASLADLVEGTLSDGRRQRLEAHLAGCEACRTTVALAARAVEEAARAMPDAAASVPPPPAWRRPGTWLRVAAAAAVLAAVGAVFTMRREPADPIEVAFASLRAARPDRFGDARPLTAGELASADGTVLRGGIDWMSPGGTTTEARPTFEWAPVAGARRYRVTITDADGVRVVTTTADEATLDGRALPAALREGADYVWRVVAVDAPTPADGATALHVATAAERAEVRDLEATVGATVHGELADLVIAQTLLRRGLNAEALPHARRFARGAPMDAVGRATLALALRRLAPSGGR